MVKKSFEALWQKSFLAQIFVIFLFWLAGLLVGSYLGLSFLSNVIGLFLLLLAIFTKVVASKNIERGANFFLSEMPLFFIPAIMAITVHSEIFTIVGVKILLVIFLGTLAVMLTSAVVVEIFTKESRRSDNE